MSSVLARDMDAYQRAYAAYKRKAQSYNNSILRDANGNTYLFANAGLGPSNGMNPESFYALGVPQQAVDNNPQIANKTTGVVGSTRDNPAGYAGLTPTADNKYALARTRAQTYAPVVLTDVVKQGNGYAVRKSYEDGSYYYQQLDPNKVDIQAVPKARPRDEQMYTATYQAPVTFAAKPKAFDMQAPEATQAQGRRAAEGSLADQERGLIGEVMASKGVRY